MFLSDSMHFHSMGIKGWAIATFGPNNGHGKSRRQFLISRSLPLYLWPRAGHCMISYVERYRHWILKPPLPSGSLQLEATISHASLYVTLSQNHHYHHHHQHHHQHQHTSPLLFIISSSFILVDTMILLRPPWRWYDDRHGIRPPCMIRSPWRSLQPYRRAEHQHQLAMVM